MDSFDELRLFIKEHEQFIKDSHKAISSIATPDFTDYLNNITSNFIIPDFGRFLEGNYAISRPSLEFCNYAKQLQLEINQAATIPIIENISKDTRAFLDELHLDIDFNIQLVNELNIVLNQSYFTELNKKIEDLKKESSKKEVHKNEHSDKSAHVTIINTSAIQNITILALEQSGFLESPADGLYNLLFHIEPIIEFVAINITNALNNHIIQKVIIGLILHILTFFIQPALKTTRDKFFNKRKAIKTIKQNVSSQPLDLSALKNHRFITADSLEVRKSETINSEIVDHLYFSNVVLVVRKKRNWMLVKYNNQEDKPVIGWIFSRYTSKFN
ncbi:SH3 domain-containing protein [Halonatronum saccharophilum]|uniref:SH3 domain-containing protein n=1 Tax=Halonatronum saccharophilum TaxID=150060 RepID=UPI0004855518|nr:SH3 domain-containing protein [Halonatronum saccharophilum]